MYTVVVKKPIIVGGFKQDVERQTNSQILFGSK